MCDIQLNGRSVASRNWRTLRVPLGSFIYVAKNRNAIIAGGADWPRETSFWARDWSNGCSGVESGTHVSAVHTAFYKRGDCCGCSVEAREEKNDNKKLAKSRSPDGAVGAGSVVRTSSGERMERVWHSTRLGTHGCGWIWWNVRRPAAGETNNNNKTNARIESREIATTIVCGVNMCDSTMG